MHAVCAVLYSILAPLSSGSQAFGSSYWNRHVSVYDGKKGFEAQLGNRSVESESAGCPDATFC